MNPKVSVYIATSLDGFIARADGDLDWLDAASALVPEGEDCGYYALMKTVDCLVMGRRTYEKVCSFGPWPYGDTAVIVLSSADIEFPADFPDNVTHSSEDPQTLCRRLASEGIGHIYIDGAETIQRFLLAGLVDELTITLIPVLLGRGISLFGPLDSDIELDCIGTRRFDFGFVMVQYRVKHSD